MVNSLPVRAAKTVGAPSMPPRRLQRLAHGASVAGDEPHPTVTVKPARRAIPSRAYRPCHKRAIHTGHDRSQVDNHGQRRSSLSRRCLLAEQVAVPPDLVLGARGRPRLQKAYPGAANVPSYNACWSALLRKWMVSAPRSLLQRLDRPR